MGSSPAYALPECGLRADYITPAQLGQLLGELTPANRLACQVAAFTGLRIGDVLALQVEQLRDTPIRVTEAKTHKVREIALPEEIKDRLRIQAGPVWCFPARAGPGHRSRQAVWADIKRAAGRMGLPQNVCCHSLRKYFAVEEFGRAKGNLDVVQQLLNHRYPSTTYIYIGSRTIYDAMYGGGRDPPG